MELSNGDYVSKLWLNEGPDAAWTIIAVLRVLTACWEITLTSDPIPEPGAIVRCATPINRVVLPSKFPEAQVCSYIESIISGYEKVGKCNRVATIDVHSADPQVFINKFYEVAQQNERISCSFCCKEIPSTQV